MPENYTGTEGTEAVSAGYDALDGTEDRRDGWLAINKTRDYIAKLKVALQAINWNSITGKPSLFPSRSDLVTRPGTTSTIEDAVNAAYGLAQSKLGSGGGTVTGHLYLPNATPATSGYTVCYLNSDGRVSKGASSARYKENIVDLDPAGLGDIWPSLVGFEMTGGDGTQRVGYIAESLDEHPDQARFVVYDDQARPDSIDFIGLLLAQNAQLHQAVDLLSQRLVTLEGDRT